MPVDQVALSSLDWFGLGVEAGGIGADLVLREGKGSDCTFGHIGQKLFLLFFCAVTKEGLGQTNGLVGGEQGGEVATAGSQEFGRPGVGGLAEAKTAVLLGYLDPKGTDFGKFLE